MPRLALALISLTTTQAGAQDPAQDAVDRTTPKVEVERGAWLRVNGEPFFPLFVFKQPPTPKTITYFADLGINTFLRNGYAKRADTTNPKLLDRLHERGMVAILQPSPAIASHPALIAWSLTDEPVHHEVSVDDFRAQRSKAIELDPALPVFANFSSKFYREGKGGTAALQLYRDFMAVPDLIGFDFYPVTGWNRPDWVAEPGRALEFMHSELLREEKPSWFLVEACNQNLAWTPEGTVGPTPAQTRYQVWSAIVHGATGIGYFTHAFNPHVFSALTPDMEQELRELNTTLSEMAPILLQEPPELAMHVTSKQDRVCETALRRDGDDWYLIALNSDMQYRSARFTFEFERQIVSVEAWKEGRSIPHEPHRFEDDFEPLGVHLYRLRFE